MAILFLSSHLFAENVTPNKFNPKVNKQVGMIQIQFDMNRIVTPTPIPGTKNPQSSRAYLPTCPPGSHYVSGVNPHLLELDQFPAFAYCNCICKGICSGLNGVTSPGGKRPLYTATVTCSATVQGWFDSGLFSPHHTTTSFTTTPHQFYYCQSGACTTRPLPASLNYSVPVGGYANTVKIDFVSCPIAVSNGCGAPDPSSIGRAAIALP